MICLCFTTNVTQYCYDICDDGLVAMKNGKHGQINVIKCPFTVKLFNKN